MIWQIAKGTEVSVSKAGRKEWKQHRTRKPLSFRECQFRDTGNNAAYVFRYGNWDLLVAARKVKQQDASKKTAKSREVSYFITDGQFIKIGKSGSKDGVMARLASLQTGHPLNLWLLGTTNVPEKKLHRMFKAERHRGEWFTPSPEMEDFMKSSQFEKAGADGPGSGKFLLGEVLNAIASLRRRKFVAKTPAQQKNAIVRAEQLLQRYDGSRRKRLESILVAAKKLMN